MRNEKEIIEKLKSGDISAFDEIYHMYNDRIYQFALGLLKDEDSANEMVQQVFISIWEKRDRIRPDLNFRNYLMTITSNAVRKYFRRKSLQNKVYENLYSDKTFWSENTEDEVIYNELYAIAQRTIDKMSPRRKEVYQLSRQKGLRINEIAKQLGISESTAESHLTQALRFLKEELSKLSISAILFFYLFIK